MKEPQMMFLFDSTTFLKPGCGLIVFFPGRESFRILPSVAGLDLGGVDQVRQNVEEAGGRQLRRNSDGDVGLRLGHLRQRLRLVQGQGQSQIYRSRQEENA